MRLLIIAGQPRSEVAGMRTSGGVVYWAISDLNLAELKQFQALVDGR
jgi:hypothetical protein